MSEMDLRDVSSHCLNNMVSAAETSGLQAAEDIYDQAGIKLLSSGYKITPETKDRLLHRKLRKPLETSLKAENGVTADQLSKEALKLIEAMPVLRQLSSTIEDEAKQLHFVTIEPLAALLLTASRDNGSNSFQHMVLMALLSRMIGRKMNLDQYHMQLLTIAAEVHDLGELYIDPEYLHTRRRLTPQEWKNVMVHPKIGEMLIREHTAYPAEVARAVLEHHERADGTGYPRKLVSKQISIIGEILIVAEVLAGMLAKPDFPMHRALLVLRLLPNEYPPQPLGILHSIVKEAKIGVPESEAVYANAAFVRPVIHALDGMKERLVSFADSSNSNVERDLAHDSKNRLSRLKQAVISLGLEHCLHPDGWINLRDDPMVRLEVEVAGREIAWRMRDISREMILQLIEAGHEASAVMQGLINEMSQISVT